MAAVRHLYVPLSAGTHLHVVEAEPTGPSRGTCVLVHGFPDTWYGWRKQIKAIAGCGFRVLVPDQRGYGDTTRPGPPVEEDFSMEEVCADMVALLDALLLPHAVFIGHDWGGTLVWNLAQQYPSRVSHVGAVCTPFFPQPAEDPWPKMLKSPGRFDYQVWFQTRDSQTELDADPGRTVRCMIRAWDDSREGVDATLEEQPPTVRKGLINVFPAEVGSKLLTPEEQRVYAGQFERCGFFGPLSWYRNVSRNWDWMKPTKGNKVVQHCLMITAEHDLVLTASMAKKYMPPHVPHCQYEHVRDAGHWVLQEQPEEINRLVVGWLANLPVASHVQEAKL